MDNSEGLKSCTDDLLPKMDLATIEQCIRDYWLSRNIPQRVIENAWNRDAPLFAFLEGPPTTNGRMHVGHARGRVYKDIVIKYYILRGYKVWALGGWDTQGLPVEIEVEKELGVKNKKDIENRIGISEFIEKCKKSVDRYISLWIKDNLEWAIWMDYSRAYETRHPRYIETIWKFIKLVHDKGLLKEEFRVIPRCPRCNTALSSHEVSLGTKKVPWPYIYFLVSVKNKERLTLPKEKLFLAVWTTTPWTIPANVALAVNKDLEYYVLECQCDEKIYVVTSTSSKGLIIEYLIKNYGCKKCEIFKRIKGRDLVGLKYIPPQEELVIIPQRVYDGGFRVVDVEWVEGKEGTGIVHIAPMHGPEDFELAKKENLPLWTPLNKEGYFENGRLKGMWFVSSTDIIVKFLKEKGLLLSYELKEHEYPHCWRCETPLLFYASKQWFIETSKVKEGLEKALENVRFHPSWAKIRMLNWIRSIRDWCISRERYWGTPLPVWKHDGDKIIIDEIKRLEKLAKTQIKDPHRPYIDVEFEVDGKKYRREKFVMDVWLDSGMAHTAALYQLGKPELLKVLFPYTLVIEPPEQIRGWFYTLLVTSYIMYGKAPYKQILMYGLVLDEKGKKMSKSKGNVVWAYKAIEKYSADVLRLFFALHTPWEDIRFRPSEFKRIRNLLNTIYSIFMFFNLYAGLDKWSTEKLTHEVKHPLNAWLINEYFKVEENIIRHIENMRFHDGFKSLLDYLVDTVSHQYIVVIRPLLWEPGLNEFKKEIYSSLWFILMKTLSFLSIVVPHLGEYLYQILKSKFDSKNKKESIFFETLDTIALPLTINVKERDTDIIKEAFMIAKAVNAAKKLLGVKRRYPLREVIIHVKATLNHLLIQDIVLIIRNYSIVKDVTITTDISKEIFRDFEKAYSSAIFDVYVPKTITKEDIQEGLAREIIRRINVFRKEIGLSIDQYIDNIVIVLHEHSEDILNAIERYKDLIKSETRVKNIQILHKGSKKFTTCKAFKISNNRINICLRNQS